MQQRVVVCAALAAVCAAPAFAAGLGDGIARGHDSVRSAPAQRLPTIAIVLDDLGDSRPAGLRAIALPGPVACAFLPGSPFSRDQAELAHARGKEVLLHLPLEPHDHAVARPAGLDRDNMPGEYETYLRAALSRVPHARGVNNHQGSLLTEQGLPMVWLMSAIRTHGGLYFLDSRTSQASVAYQVAVASGIPAARRDVFLDVEPGLAAAQAAVETLVARARREGHALAIGHPYPETFAVLERELPNLAARGVRLVSPSRTIVPAAVRPQLKLSPRLNSRAATATGPALRAPTSVAAR